MSMTEKDAPELSVVLMDDGKDGTIVHVFPEHDAFLLETDENEILTYHYSQIKEVVWKPK